MMNSVLFFDQQVFLLINHLPHNEVSDAVGKFFSLIGSVGFVWFVIGVLLFLKEEKKHHMFFAPIIAAGGVSYVLVEWIIKPLVARPRPTPVLADYSFPSGHATVAFAMAMILSFYEPKFKIFFFTLAFCISLSRVFLGFHYPLDVIVGGMLGWVVGKASYRLKK